jgi:hypothetical protein
MPTWSVVAGALAERCQLGAYFIYSPILTGFVYPLGTLSESRTKRLPFPPKKINIKTTSQQELLC